MINRALQLIAAALGVQPGEGIDCALCGPSPFPYAQPLGLGFADWYRVNGDAICAGCAKILGGRPGARPRPLRTTSFLATCNQYRELSLTDLWSVIDSPPDGEFVLSWSTGGKRHHALYAGVSCAPDLQIGSDTQTIRLHLERDKALLKAIRGLLYTPKKYPIISREQIRTGKYNPNSLNEFGLERWAPLEETVARYRPSMLLELVVACTPVTLEQPTGGDGVIDTYDQQAATLLGEIAWCADERTENGLEFWKSLFQRRVARYHQRSLGAVVAGLLRDLRCSPLNAGDVVRLMVGYTVEQEIGIAEAITDRPVFIIALAREMVVERQKERKNQ